jgi:predicted transcriptional regulator
MIVIEQYQRPQMTVKEQIHQLVEQMPEQSLVEVRQFIEDLGTAVEPEDESLDQETLESLDRGLADSKAGRVKPLEEYERERR